MGELIDLALHSAEGCTPVPEDLQPALSTGIAAAGGGFNMQRYWYLAYLTAFAAAWKDLPAQDREQCLADPWRFKEFLFSLPIHGAQAQREALLHLVHPSSFERIVSERHKGMIAKAFEQLAPEGIRDTDRRLAAVKEKLADSYNSDAHFFYQPEIRKRWDDNFVDAESQWDELVFWIAKFIDWDEFDQNERDYKLRTGEQLARVRQALGAGEEWLPLLKGALGKTNLVSWRNVPRFIAWCEEHPAEAAQALRTLWESDAPVPERIDTFTEQTEAAGRGEPTRFAATLLMALGSTDHPPFAKEAMARAYGWVEEEPPPDEAAPSKHYLRAMEFFDRVIEEAADRDVELRDRTDAQGAVWSIGNYVAKNPPISGWSEEDRKDFLQFRGDTVGGGDPLGALADEQLWERDDLARIEKLLRAKRQVIFYGPPGTGKTYVARELATLLAGGSENVHLVQFHPSYAYEDFVEGYRPSGAGGGAFELVQGSLRRAAAAARAAPDQTVILVVDELNRGNVAKVFGELFFLLEYRDEAIDLQYSRDRFSLPENLWIIGTMNTADRSIALIDAALRRRFYFVPFLTDSPPISGLLERWLERHKPHLRWVADVVDRANERLADPHFSIGPSYFMRSDLTEEWVGLIWEHSILPYLEERFFGSRDELDQYRLPALRARPPSASPTHEDDDAIADFS